MMEKKENIDLENENLVRNKVERKDRDSLNGNLNIKRQYYFVMMVSVCAPPLLSSVCVRLWDSLT